MGVRVQGPNGKFKPGLQQVPFITRLSPTIPVACEVYAGVFALAGKGAVLGLLSSPPVRADRRWRRDEIRSVPVRLLPVGARFDA